MSGGCWSAYRSGRDEDRAFGPAKEDGKILGDQSPDSPKMASTSRAASASRWQWSTKPSGIRANSSSNFSRGRLALIQGLAVSYWRRETFKIAHGFSCFKVFNMWGL